MSRNSSIRRRPTSAFSVGTDYIPVYREDEAFVRRKSSFRGFLVEKNLELNDELTEDIKTDVLFPQFKRAMKEDQGVDMEAFQHMIQTPLVSSKQTKLRDERFKLYSSDKTTHFSIGLEDLLNQKGQKALESLLKSKGWWMDVFYPTAEEMRVLSKTFHIHPLTTEDIQAQEPREKVEIFPNYTFVCFRSFEIDSITDQIKPFNYYSLIFKEGFLTFHFKKSNHDTAVRERCNQLKEYMLITPDWMNYALIDSITDNFAPVIQEIEMEAVSIDELSLVLRKSEQADMLKRISRCRKKSTQLSRLLSSKLDVIKSLMKRYEDKTRELNLIEPNQPIQLHHLQKAASHSRFNMTDTQTFSNVIEIKKSFSDVLLYLGDIQDHVVTMVQNINHYDRILHRAHTNYLAQVNLELIETYNMTNSVMNRLTFFATIFIPLTLICSLWGMNVSVPGMYYTDHIFFFWILGGMTIYCIVCIFYGKRAGLV